MIQMIFGFAYALVGTQDSTDMRIFVLDLAIRVDDVKWFADAYHPIPAERPDALRRTIRFMANRLDDASPTMRRYMLGQIAASRDNVVLVIPALVRLIAKRPGDLRNPVDVQLDRTWAMLCLGVAGAGAKEALPDLVLCTHSDEPEVRYGAWIAIHRIAPDTLEITPALREGLQSKTGSVQLAALKAVIAIGPSRSFDLWPEISQLGRSDDYFVRVQWSQSLLGLIPAGREQEAVLILKQSLARIDGQAERLFTSGTTHGNAVLGRSLLNNERSRVQRALDRLGE